MLLTLRTLLCDPLLLKELVSQARRPARAGWTYRSPILFILVTLPPAVVYVKLRLSGQTSEAQTFFLVAALLQTWLLCLRSCLYTCASMAHEVRQGTIPVLLSTPLSLGRALAAKMTACLFPLWLELTVALPLALGVYSWQGETPASLVLGITAFQLAASLLFGGLGLWLGSLLPDPEKAANTARVLVVALLLATFLDGQYLPWPIVVVGLLLWVCLVWLPQVRPSQAVQGSIAALMMLLVLPVIYHVAQGFMNQIDLSTLNPLRAVFEAATLYGSGPQPGGPGLLVVGGLYLAAGLVFFRMALGRARHLVTGRPPA
jgi:ABC-type multidrug transport system permease subunit